ncbi:MAG: (2Fe-2S) ferredoxin domain-containing protein [Deltaproteobacteria bacterium]|nr:(2Fe-2S) ferredoxin domain-containing protein [Deltaproteobacteria bacterium]
MAPYKKHVFICTNVRPPGSPRGCCAEKGSEELRSLFKKGLKARGLAGDVRANAAGCLDTCEAGPSIVVYPEGVWYGGVKPEDVAEILDEHLVNGRPVERLKMKFPIVKKGGGD